MMSCGAIVAAAVDSALAAVDFAAVSAPSTFTAIVAVSIALRFAGRSVSTALSTALVSALSAAVHSELVELVELVDELVSALTALVSAIVAAVQTTVVEEEFEAQCPMGHWCSAGNTIPCPVSTYNNETNKIESSTRLANTRRAIVDSAKRTARFS